MHQQVTLRAGFRRTRFTFIRPFIFIYQSCALFIWTENHIFIRIDYERVGIPYILIENLRWEDLLTQGFGTLLRATVIETLDLIYVAMVQFWIYVLTPTVLTVRVLTFINFPEFGFQNLSATDVAHSVLVMVAWFLLANFTEVGVFSLCEWVQSEAARVGGVAV